MGDEVDLQIAGQRIAVVREGADRGSPCSAWSWLSASCGGTCCSGRMPTSGRWWRRSRRGRAGGPPASRWRWPCRSRAATRPGRTALRRLPQMRSAASQRTIRACAHRLVVGAPSHDGAVGSEGAVGGEQSDGVLAVAAGDGDELVEDLALVGLGGLLVTLTQHLEQLALGLLADLCPASCLPPVVGNIP